MVKCKTLVTSFCLLAAFGCQKPTSTDQALTAEVPLHLEEHLDAVHQEGLRAPTLYSNIFDLKNGIAYLYDRHRYDRVAKLDVAETIRQALGRLGFGRALKN